VSNADFGQPTGVLQLMLPTDSRSGVVALYYQHPGTWFGDCMPVYAEDAFQLFHQRDNRRPGPFGEPFGWALARTTDFVNFADLGDVIPGGGDDAQDQFIFAGSVFAAHGRYYAMYTGYNRDFPERGRPAQSLLLATSDDLVTWTKTGTEVVGPQPGYDPDNWRDPFVLRDEENDRWIMILGARHDGPFVQSGRTVWLTSTDLQSWDFQGDFWAPGLYSMHEMPDLFRIGDWWYLLTTEYSDKSKTIYRMSGSLNGPWSAPVDDAFDGRAYYAARSATDGTHRYLFGWVPTKEGETDLGAEQWGGTLVVHEVFQRPDGSLGVRIPDSVRTAFASPTADPARTLDAPDGRKSMKLGPAPGDTYLVRARVRAAARSFSVRLAADASTGDAYAFTVNPGEGRLTFDKTPNYPWFRYENRGHERPLRPAPDGRYDIDIVVDNTIMTLYVDGVALNARAYDKSGGDIEIDVIDGSLTVESCTVAAAL
jgi:beta-fructofuranosidase